MRISVSLLLSAAALSIVAGHAVAGEYIYQWKDKTGQYVYSDNPPPGNIPSRMYNSPDAKTPGISRPATFYYK